MNNDFVFSKIQRQAQVGRPIDGETLSQTMIKSRSRTAEKAVDRATTLETLRRTRNPLGYMNIYVKGATVI